MFRFDRQQGWQESPDAVTVEEPLEIRLVFGPDTKRENRSLAITMRTPGHDTDLVRGFLFSEGLITDMSQIQSMKLINTRQEAGRGHTIEVHLAPEVTLDWTTLERHFYLTSSCGVCGKASIDAVMQNLHVELFPLEPRLDAVTILGLPDRLRKQQSLFSVTGGIHASGLFDLKGNLLLLREDVGRHNAMDKLIGSLQADGGSYSDLAAVVLSGRASFELVQKALISSIPILIAVGAPSSLAIDLAEEGGLTLIGFTGQERFNVYTGRQRVEESI
ncbi:MAG: formate dehydrogenase accessory sulfurtransferase FdhD [Saprospiraceae bacterium]|nr:formate dehydrogenase accessory sulfurtransferase FdhD [Saprospiraceae bacterium]